MVTLGHVMGVFSGFNIVFLRFMLFILPRLSYFSTEVIWVSLSLLEAKVISAHKHLLLLRQGLNM